MPFTPKVDTPPPRLSIEAITQRLNAIEYELRKIKHDHTQFLIWISNTRKRLIELEIYNDHGDYLDSAPKPFTDGAPIIPLPKKKRRKTQQSFSSGKTSK